MSIDAASYAGAALVNEVQLIQLVRPASPATPYESWSGRFALSFNTESFGGGEYVTSTIYASSVPSISDESTHENAPMGRRIGDSLQSILQAMPNIGRVEVEEMASANSGRTRGFKVTFKTLRGPLPMLQVAWSELDAADAYVITERLVRGRAFSLRFVSASLSLTSAGFEVLPPLPPFEDSPSLFIFNSTNASNTTMAMATNYSALINSSSSSSSSSNTTNTTE